MGCEDSTIGVVSPTVVSLRGELHYVPPQSCVPQWPCRCSNVPTPHCRHDTTSTGDPLQSVAVPDVTVFPPPERAISSVSADSPHR
jgi:hypothetical protein